MRTVRVRLPLPEAATAQSCGLTAPGLQGPGSHGEIFQYVEKYFRGVKIFSSN